MRERVRAGPWICGLEDPVDGTATGTIGEAVVLGINEEFIFRY